jgi:hypothetical protein
MPEEGKDQSLKIQMIDKNVVVDDITFGGSVGGEIRISHTIGYTADQVSVLLT